MSLLAAFGETQHPAKLAAVESALYGTIGSTQFRPIHAAIVQTFVPALFAAKCAANVTAIDAAFVCALWSAIDATFSAAEQQAKFSAEFDAQLPAFN